jgi:nicotinamidase-related amidase
MESHICVTQAALGALREGYLVHVASDAVSSPDGVELESWAGTNAECGRGDFVNGDDDL